MPSKRSIYIFSSGELKRQENTLWLIGEEEKKAIPVEAVDDLNVFGEVTVNKRLLEFLTRNQIPVHFFNHYEYYVGSYYPREHLNSGYLTLQQAACYLDPAKRLDLARRFVDGAMANMLKALGYYARRGKVLGGQIGLIGDLRARAAEVSAIDELLAAEGNARRLYYDAWNAIIDDETFAFAGRERRPPSNPINALISFGNSMLYVRALSALYQTQLDPRIGFLHATNQRSFSLNLDLAEIFKPILVDRVIFELVNHRRLNKRDFGMELDGCYLTEAGRKTFVGAFEEKLAATIQHRTLHRKVANRELIRLEAYKLYRHFIEEDAYQPYEALW